jgi:hypothetical protein
MASNKYPIVRTIIRNQTFQVVSAFLVFWTIVYMRLGLLK